MRLKSDLYAPEQAAIKQRVIDILQLDELNSTTLYDLDRNIEKQNKLMELIPEIRKFFSFGKMTGVTEPTHIQRPWLGIVKYMTRDEYEILKCDYRFRHPDTNEVIRTKRYVFQRKPNT
jgi:hypothetical protein